jgi:methionyl-tRNA formyltransferase
MSNTNEKIEKNQPWRLAFMGTPDFATPGLKALINDERFQVVTVFTQTDKESGRGQIKQEPPVKKLAAANNITVFQAEKIRTEAETIKKLDLDLIVVIAYGQIIPKDILEAPRYGCFNVHASLLPKYRGAACLNAPIMNGDSESGVTIMKMDEGLDAGPIIRQEKIILDKKETLSTLHDKLSKLGAEILPETLNDYLIGKIESRVQDQESSSYIGLLKKKDGQINWNDTAEKIERLVRALNPWPGTFSRDAKNKQIKILEAACLNQETEKHKIGEVFLSENRLAVQTGQGALLILKLQTEGARALFSNDFLNGNPSFIGQILQ